MFYSPFLRLSAHFILYPLSLNLYKGVILKEVGWMIKREFEKRRGKKSRVPTLLPIKLTL